MFHNAFDEARLLPGVVARQRGAAGLSRTCAGCADLARLVHHVRDRVLADVARLSGTASVAERDESPPPP
ncbi:hypothetical protein [Streptomyces mayteni]